MAYTILTITSLILHTPQSMPFCTSTTTTATPMSFSQVLNVYTFSRILINQKSTIPNGCHNVSRPPYIDASRLYAATTLVVSFSHGFKSFRQKKTITTYNYDYSGVNLWDWCYFIEPTESPTAASQRPPEKDRFGENSRKTAQSKDQ